MDPLEQPITLSTYQRSLVRIRDSLGTVRGRSEEQPYSTCLLRSFAQKVRQQLSSFPSREGHDFSALNTVNANIIHIKGMQSALRRQLSKSQSVETPDTSGEKSEIIVKLRDSTSKALLQIMPPKELCKRINDILFREIHKVGRLVQIEAASQLRSGDVSIHTANHADAWTLLNVSNVWIPFLDNNGTAFKRTYGVLVHSVETLKSIIDPSCATECVEKIRSENSHLHAGITVVYVGWLSNKAKIRSESSLIVEFETPEDANRVIREGLIVGGRRRECELYDRRCKIRQCYRCQRYGHIGTQCIEEVACGFCAEAHDTRDCLKKGNARSCPRCALCNGSHSAWSRICNARLNELERVAQAHRSRRTYYNIVQDKDRKPHAAPT